MASAGSVFSETLQTITTTKLEELAKQRISFEEKYAALRAAAQAETNLFKRVALLLDGIKGCLGVKTSTKKGKDGQSGRVIIGGTGNPRLERDLSNLERFFEQARFDPSVSSKVLENWEKTLVDYLSVQSTKFQYADLYGKLVTEWLSSEKVTPTDGDTEMTESFEELPGAKRLSARAEWEKMVFEPASVDTEAVKTYLHKLFIADKKDGAAALSELRDEVEFFESSFNDSSQFNTYNLRSTIRGLQNSDLLSNEKRAALKDFLSNDIILTEIVDILNVRMSALDRWTWGDYVAVEQRKKLNGGFSVHFDPDLLQAIFLHYIGVKWSVFLKGAFKTIYKHKAWASSNTQVSKTDRLRRSYFLGKRGAKTSPTLQNKRVKTNRSRYFAHQLLDHDNQAIEMEEGEEEADFEEYAGTASIQAARSAPRVQLASKAARKSVSMPMQNASFSASSPAPQGFGMGGAMRHRKVAPQSDFELELDMGEEEEEDDDEEDEDDSDNEDWQIKFPMRIKQDLLHILATEIIVNTRLHGELTTFRTAFQAWNSLLPHETILTVLEFLGVSKKWIVFMKKFLQAPLKFTDDPSSAPRLRRCGAPGSHTLSDVLGEAVLFCLDFSINQATDGALTYRLYDDVWFWNKDYEKCAKAWASTVEFAEVMGVKIDYKKTGSVRISRNKDLELDDRLPEGEIRWGFLYLHPSNGRFEIDQKMVDGHVEELRKQLQGKSKSIIDYIQVWNSYAATFFSSNFGKASNCFGREHVDKMLATHRHIQESIFPGGSIVQHVKDMIQDRFAVSNIPDGFLFFPVELGGLDLKSPFVGLLQIRESVKEDPYELLEDFEQAEVAGYATAQQRFDKGIIGNWRYNTEDPNWKPEDPDTFFTFEEFSRFREEFVGIGKARLLNTYSKLLQRPDEEPIDPSPQINQALTHLSSQNNLRGILASWGAMDAYWKWIAQMYGPEITQKFGGLNVVDFGLLPIGMVSMFRQRRTKWQG
ncbi:hypothetical protein IQ07DRAFT_566679 [Pyrenochaeta sp. DS3sAY3a]|nr:hypothetical protein IQ07DRAFT_566679 [Pyrenochaeta sp. DS3sAY3a]